MHTEQNLLLALAFEGLQFIPKQRSAKCVLNPPLCINTVKMSSLYVQRCGGGL